MALTADEEKYIKDQKILSDLAADITQLNIVAQTAMDTKRDEIKVLQDQLTTDVVAKQTAIDEVKNA